MSQRRDLRIFTFGVCSATCIAGFAFSVAPQGGKAKTTVDFNRDVRPILSQHCWPCHGQDKEALKRTKNMRLDSFEGATADRGGYKAIVPGHPESSALLKRVGSDIPAMRMPPPDSGIKPLAGSEIAILQKWIAEGAEYRAHWAFIAPKMPALPAVRDSKWIRNDIDRFVLSKLEAEGLKPQPEADKATLIRRATFTLTGLPPTLAEVSAFLSDKRPDAYDRLVDRLLDSARFGENQARYWLDAVRYADTHGFHIDNERSIFPYRDWVIRAYNQDIPYNQFIIWQLAGDLLPNPTLDQKIATGYVRLNPTTNEGGAIEAEFLARNTFDRVDTTATVFMALTLQCAKCHDHKYDPLSQRDYYSMCAFFNSTVDTPLDGNLRLHEPVMKAPNPEQAARLASLSSDMESAIAKTNVQDAVKWAANISGKLPSTGAWETTGPFKAKDFDSAFSTNFGPEPGGKDDTKWKPIDFELDKPIKGIVGTENAAAYLRTKVRVDSPVDLDLRLGSDDGIKVWLNGALVHQNKIQRGLAPDQDVAPVSLRAGDNDLLVKIVNGASEDGAFVGVGGPTEKRLARAREIAAGLVKGEARGEGSGGTKARNERQGTVQLFGPEPPLLNPRFGKKGAASRDHSRVAVALGRRVASTGSGSTEHAAAERELVATYLDLGPNTAEAARYRQCEVDYRVLDASIPMTYVAKEMAMPRKTFVLKRGQYDQPGVEVTRAIPAIFGSLPADYPKNRLGLAKWITDPKNPLTARVMVNRIWQQHFGLGIVKSSEDFGSRGDWPSDPELLDYLACRFVKDGWSIKKLTRLIVTSAAFRQSSAAPATVVAKDPDNALISRGPRFRLDAEVIRDTALYTSGLLIEHPGGHADKPYQPKGLWSIIAYPISDTAHYVQDHGQALYRRSIYLFWKRTSPPPTMLILDAPMRESCVVRRSRTNTPTQALVTLNETGFFEDARNMAQHVMKAKSGDASRIDYAFRLATSRSPNPEESRVIEAYLKEQRQRYRKNPGDAEKTLSIGESPRDKSLPAPEHAAWTLVCNMILNLDETLTQH